MDSGPGGGIVDSAGAHVARCSSCPTLVSGRHGSGYRFTSSDSIQITYASDLDAGAGFTSALWVWIDQIPSAQACAFSKPFDVAKAWDTFVICVQTDGTTFFDGESTTGSSDMIDGPTISTGAWHHLAFVWDGVHKRAYVDGTLLGEHTIAIGSSTDALVVGTSFVGIVDDVLFYTRALSAAEVAMLAGS